VIALVVYSFVSIDDLKTPDYFFYTSFHGGTFVRLVMNSQPPVPKKRRLDSPVYSGVSATTGEQLWNRHSSHQIQTSQDSLSIMNLGDQALPSAPQYQMTPTEDPVAGSTAEFWCFGTVGNTVSTDDDPTNNARSSKACKGHAGSLTMKPKPMT
jgi:hypothetical protein